MLSPQAQSIPETQISEPHKQDCKFDPYQEHYRIAATDPVATLATYASLKVEPVPAAVRAKA